MIVRAPATSARVRHFGPGLSVIAKKYRPRPRGLRGLGGFGLGDCLDLGYKLSNQEMCRDNNTGNMIACSSSACAAPPIGSAGASAPSWQPYSVGCTPKQYSTFAPAPNPPKDPCIIKNAVPCLPVDWPARNSGYYDADPGVPDCASFSGPASFGIPVAAYQASAPLLQGQPATVAPPIAAPPAIPPPSAPPGATVVVGSGVAQSNAPRALAVVPGGVVPSGFDLSGFQVPEILTADSLIKGVPNWLLGAGVLAVAFVFKGGR